MATPPDREPFAAGRIKALLTSLPQCRPDLMALKAGYGSQEARVRAAILAQFPSLSIGFNRDRDTDNLHTVGLSISLNLPLFSGNRGEIAIERATRERLKAEYNARLVQTANDVDQLTALESIISEQATLLEHHLPMLRKLIDRARAARDRGDMDALTFLNLESTWVNKRLEQIRLEQLQRETDIALQAALALPDGAPPAPAQ